MTRVQTPPRPRPDYAFDGGRRPCVAPSRLNYPLQPATRTWPYRLVVSVGRLIMAVCIRRHVLRSEVPEQAGPYILALTHLSHLDPFLCCLVVRRKVDFIASVGFYRFAPTAWFMRAMQTIAIHRQGVPISTFRKAIAHLQRGRIVGICPEGGVAQGPASAMRGASIKRGVCLLAQRTGVPVLPAIMLGTDKLNAVRPWLPLWQARLYVSFGDLLPPPDPALDRRAAREQLAGQLEQAYVRLFHELLESGRIDPASVP